MLKIYLTRHGQDIDNANGILNGRRDEPLTGLGIEQAKQVAAKIKEAGLIFDKVYSSPLGRALQTAEIISDYLNLSEPIQLPDLIERDQGAMTGRRVCDIEKLCSPDILKTDSVTYFLHAKDAETWPGMKERAKRLLDHIRADEKDGSILLVTHGCFGKMFYAAYYDLDWMKTLKMFHFGNSDLLLLSEDSRPEDTHVFKNRQYNA